MRRNGTLALMGAACGAGLGAMQVVRDNAAQWDAVRATLATEAVQVLAGALLGGAFVGALVFYWAARRRAGGIGPRATGEPMAVAASPVGPRVYGMRQVFILMFGLGLLAVGGVVLLACMRHPTVYGLLRGAFGALFLMALGGYLIWDDFVAPSMRRQQL